MRKVLGAAWRVALGLMVLSLVVFAGYGFMYRQAAGDRTSPVVLQTLDEEARIEWSPDGVPAIKAGSPRDAYRLLGWAHARDRLWQMEMLRRLGQGTLAEVLGKSVLPVDHEMRALGLYRMAEDDAGMLDKNTRDDLEAYAEGVNAYLLSRPTLPVEFRLSGVQPVPWRLADSLVWCRIIALQLSGNFKEEALRAKLQGAVSADVLEALFPGAPTGKEKAASSLAVDWSRFLASQPPPLGPTRASNAWVVDGSMTRSGKPLLANDPHMGFSMPVMWYLASVDAGDLHVAGATVPGIPYHVLGHNDRVAWGFTAGGGDTSDLFIEKVDPGHSDRYLADGGSRPFLTRNETINVRYGDPVRIVVRSTVHGPVISDFNDRVRSEVGAEKVVALSLVAGMPGNTSIQALRGINRAQDAAALGEALKSWVSPVMNVAYADTTGHISMTVAGRVPLRSVRTDDFPSDGSNPLTAWSGLSQGGSLPSVENPASHRLVNANDRVGDGQVTVHIAYRFGVPFRALRIGQLLDAGQRFGIEDFIRMQMDVRDLSAQALLPVFLQAKPQGDGARRMLALLEGWNGDMVAGKPQPLIYNALASKIEPQLLMDLVGQDAHLVPSVVYIDAGMKARLLALETASRRQALLSDAVDAVYEALSHTYGGDPSRWSWSDAHVAVFNHPLFGQLPLLKQWLSPVEHVGGAGDTINAEETFSWDHTHFTSAAGPGFRAVYDLSRLSQSKFMTATGQSGDPFSPHYDDFVTRWMSGDTMTLDQASPARTAIQRFSH